MCWIMKNCVEKKCHSLFINRQILRVQQAVSLSKLWHESGSLIALYHLLEVTLKLSLERRRWPKSSGYESTYVSVALKSNLIVRRWPCYCLFVSFPAFFLSVRLMSMTFSIFCFPENEAAVFFFSFIHYHILEIQQWTSAMVDVREPHVQGFSGLMSKTQDDMKSECCVLCPCKRLYLIPSPRQYSNCLGLGRLLKNVLKVQNSCAGDVTIDK